MEQTTEISVSKTIKTEHVHRHDDHSLISRAMQIVNNTFDCSCMALFGIVAESGNLTDGKRDVRMHIGR